MKSVSFLLSDVILELIKEAPSINDTVRTSNEHYLCLKKERKKVT
jgi:hypothetical protein